MTGPLIGVLHVRAIHAYEVEDVSALPGFRMLGAVMGLHGIAMNGGGIENLFFNDRMHAVDDAIEGFQWLGLTDIATLVARGVGGAQQAGGRVSTLSEGHLGDCCGASIRGAPLVAVSGQLS